MAKHQHVVKLGLLRVYDCSCALLCAFVLSLAFIKPAFAYVDPSVMTYTIQALAGVAVALSAVAGVAFRRTRKTLMRMLNIDENANKIVDPPILRLDEDGKPIREPGQPGGNRARAAQQNNARDGYAAQGGQPDAPLNWPRRLWRAALVALFAVGTVFIVAPAEMVAANTDSLFFTLSDVWWPLLGSAFVIIAVMALVMSLFPGKAFDFLLILVAAIGICFYVQALFLNRSLPSADGATLELSRHIGITVLSCVVWLAILIGAFLLFKNNRRLGRTLGIAMSLVLVIVQGVGVISLWVSPQSIKGGYDAESASDAINAGKSATITREGLFELSPQNNVVVFVLDAFDVINMNDIVDYAPEALYEMTGFTYFKNSTGSSVPTRYGVAYLLTGSWPRADETWDEYLVNRYTESHLLDDVLAQNYSLYVFTDTPGAHGGLEYLAPRATNVHSLDNQETHVTTSINVGPTIDMLHKMALYRDMPWILKPPFWFYTGDINTAAVNVETYETATDDASRAGSNAPYVLDDPAYYQELQNHHLSICDDGATGSVHFIHLFGAHHPYMMDEYGQETDEEVSANEQCLGSLRIVSEYLRQMKELGVYDQSTIIITADHGCWYWDEEIETSESDGDMAGGPIMLVKPSQTAEEAAQPFVISDTRTGHVDYPATLIGAVGGNAAAYGTTVFDEHDPNRIRYYYWPTHDGTNDLIIYEYAIDGEVTDFDAWSRTGVQWDFYK